MRSPHATCTDSEYQFQTVVIRNARIQSTSTVENKPLDIALRVTTIATLIVVSICVGSFGSSNISSYGHESGAAASSETAQVGGARNQTVKPDPLAGHIDKFGDRMERYFEKVSNDRFTQAEIARLTDLVQAARQQTDASGTRLQQEIGSLRVTSEVELREMNRQITSMSAGNRQIERQMVIQHAGVLAALEQQQVTVNGQVTQLNGGLKDIHSELADLRSLSQTSFASIQAATTIQAAQLAARTPAPVIQHSFAPVGDTVRRFSSRPDGVPTIWRKPVVLGAPTSNGQPAPPSAMAPSSRMSADWAVSPMSHSIPIEELIATAPTLSEPLPQEPPVTPEHSVIELPVPLPTTIQDSSSDTDSNLAAASLQPTLMESTLAPTLLPSLVPEITEPSREEPSPFSKPWVASDRQIDPPALASMPADHEPASHDSVVDVNAGDLIGREFHIETTVIHITASRPDDIEPVGIRMLNPELATTAYGESWTHVGVAHEILRSILARTDANIAGRQSTTIRSGETGHLVIGYSCPHCNEVHGFKAGDRLVVNAEADCDNIQRFHISSEASDNGSQLPSIPNFELTPVTGRTYVISEKGIAGTIEDSVISHGDQSTRHMQRLVIVTFTERGVDKGVSRIITASSVSSPATDVPFPVSLTLPSPEPSAGVAVQKLTPVDSHPVFLPPPAAQSSIDFFGNDHDIEFVSTSSASDTPIAITHATHQTDDVDCEVCRKKYDKQERPDLATAELDTVDLPVTDTDTNVSGNRLTRLIRRIRGVSIGSKSESKVTDAAFRFEVKERESVKKPVKTVKRKRRYVKKPGNR